MKISKTKNIHDEKIFFDGIFFKRWIWEPVSNGSILVLSSLFRTYKVMSPNWLKGLLTDLLVGGGALAEWALVQNAKLC